MILSDREIRAAIRSKAIRITPFPEENRWSSTAVDLTLDAPLKVWKPDSAGRVSVIDVGSKSFNLTELVQQGADDADCETGYTIERGQFILGWTIEKVQLPHASRVAARVEGKSSLARLGIGVHVTAPTVHAGFGFDPREIDFEGSPIQLEIWNVGPLNVKIRRGIPICQLIFEEVREVPEKGYSGRFTRQGPT